MTGRYSIEVDDVVGPPVNGWRTRTPGWQVYLSLRVPIPRELLQPAEFDANSAVFLEAQKKAQQSIEELFDRAILERR